MGAREITRLQEKCKDKKQNKKHLYYIDSKSIVINDHWWYSGPELPYLQFKKFCVSINSQDMSVIF